MTKYLNWIFPIIFNLDFIKNLDVILNPVIKNWLFIPLFAWVHEQKTGFSEKPVFCALLNGFSMNSFETMIAYHICRNTDNQSAIISES